MRKHLSGMATQKIQQFCSKCLREIPREQKRCSDRACKTSDMSYYAVLPFECHLEEMFKGNINFVLVHVQSWYM